ncbi:Predicted nucleotide-binding protein containing TIR-like domain-containing protein [Frankineae bacterium MT45]|nr:Predicted nucleotide-binding protein containing TIR-like domain-containing protein [Frankineae bacterium MT45]
MSAPSPPVRLFLGSSSEGRDIARHLQAELGPTIEVVRWDQNVFEPGGYTLDSLIAAATSVDFAVLVATPDDTTVSRGEAKPSARDNIVLEFGLFTGALGRQRTYLMATGELKLPTDVLGLTRLPYRAQSNPRAAVNDAALQLEERARSLGPLARENSRAELGISRTALDREVDLLCENAVSQGWIVKTNSATTLRLRSPGKRVFTLSKSQTERTRSELRRFAAELRATGLRVNSVVRRPEAESPL